MDNIYLHAIYVEYQRYNREETLKKLNYILSSDAILSRRLQNKDPYGFNGLDYISLCDYDKRNMQHEVIPGYTAFYSYVEESLALMFPKDKIKVITPEIVNFIGISQSGLAKMLKLGLSEDKRYSDLPDEVQAKDRIPLLLMNGITIPLHKMTKGYFSEKLATSIILKHLEQIKELLIKYNHDVPMYDIKSFISLDKEENIKTLVKKYQKEI